MDDLIVKAKLVRITPRDSATPLNPSGESSSVTTRCTQERLGLADVEITLNTYTHVVSDQHRQAGELIDKVYAGPAHGQSSAG